MSNGVLTYIPLENPKRGGAMDFTHVRVSVYYYKDSNPRGIVLSVNACENRDGFSRELLTYGGTNPGIYRVIQPMERANKKAETAIRDRIMREIENRSGEYWTEISKIVDAYTEQPVAV